MSTKISTSVNIAGVELKNPVMTASGTFGSGAEYSEFVDLSKLGAVVWILNTTWKGKKYIFAMNGQTGKIVGDLPADNGAFW